LDENPGDFKSTVDFTVVQLFTRDRHKSIYGNQVDTDKADSTGRVVGVDVNLTGLFVVFKSKDRAERFVTALTHAVQLCGGRASDFAPTPTSK
jgi:transposase